MFIFLRKINHYQPIIMIINFTEKNELALVNISFYVEGNIKAEKEICTQMSPIIVD